MLNGTGVFENSAENKTYCQDKKKMMWFNWQWENTPSETNRLRIFWGEEGGRVAYQSLD